METFLIFIGLLILVFGVRAMVRKNKAESMRNEVLEEIRKENPNFDEELKKSMDDAQERLRRQELYLKARKKLGHDLGFGWQDICNDDERWAEIKPKILKVLNED